MASEFQIYGTFDLSSEIEDAVRREMSSATKSPPDGKVVFDLEDQLVACTAFHSSPKSVRRFRRRPLSEVLWFRVLDRDRDLEASDHIVRCANEVLTTTPDDLILTFYETVWLSRLDGRIELYRAKVPVPNEFWTDERARMITSPFTFVRRDTRIDR